MDPVSVVDMAAPSPLLNRFSQLSTSTMDDDSLSDLHDSPLSNNISECETSFKEDPCLEGRESKHLNHHIGADQEDLYNSLNGEGFDSYSVPTQSPNSRKSSHSDSNKDWPFPRDEQLTEKQTLEITNSTPSSPKSQHSSFTFDREQLDDPRGIIERSISDEEKKAKISTLFARAASNGDLNRIIDILDNFRDWVDINTHEEDGSTPLIYASCFGQTAAVFMLLDAGASVDERDQFGWTALVWATNNKHEDIIRLLLDHGASPTARTAKGRTVADFLRHDPNDTTKIEQIFQEPSTRSVLFGDGSFLHDKATTPDSDQSHKEVMTESEEHHQINKEHNQSFTSTNLLGSDNSLSDQSQVDEDEDSEFDWNRCLHDQMFVFSSKDIPHIVETVITTMETVITTMEPVSKSYKPISAYVIFLAARFAHNFSTPELLQDLLHATIVAIHSVTTSKPDDIALKAYWISNTCALAHFLHKDAGLRPKSELYKAKLESLVQNIAKLIVLDVERRIDRVIETAMLEHNTIVGLDEVKFQPEWAFGFWRGRAGKNDGNNSNSNSNSNNNNNKRASAPPASPQQLHFLQPPSRLSLQIKRSISPSQVNDSPRTVTSILSSILYLMQSYDVHPEIIHYVIAQLLYSISSEVFNRMMNNRKFLSRSKALQTRLNVSVLEDWLRNNKLPSRLADQIAPLVQLLQLLQVLSQQNDLETWVETRKKVELLNSTHVKHVVSLYRYEVNEQRLPAEVVKYVKQAAGETENVKRQSIEKIESSSNSGSDTLSRRSSNSQGSSVHGSLESGSDEDGEAPTVGLESSRVSEEDYIPSMTTKDSRNWIHFTMPVDLAMRDGGVERIFVPQIPEEIMTILDKN